jgi:hypothetical protein
MTDVETENVRTVSAGFHMSLDGFIAQLPANASESVVVPACSRRCFKTG